MKKLLLLIAIMNSIENYLIAQNGHIRTVLVNERVSTHFICSEPVQYVDISTDKAVGDMPLPNIVRVKPREGLDTDLGIVTIVAQKYMVQFRLVHASSAVAESRVLVQQEDGTGLMISEMDLGYDDLRAFGLRILQQKEKKPKSSNKTNGIETRLNNIYTAGDYFLVDITILNHTNIKYDIDQMRFKIEDRKINKATNVQAVEIKPEYQFYNMNSFQKKYRNVLAFKKFTYPNQKVFTIELSEKQISGRNNTLKIDYKDVLNADVL